jgi:hypothetical protein
MCPAGQLTGMVRERPLRLTACGARRRRQPFEDVIQVEDQEDQAAPSGENRRIRGGAKRLP